MKNIYRIIQTIVLCLLTTGSLMAQTPADSSAAAAPAGALPTLLYSWSFYYIAFLFIIMFIAIIVMARVMSRVTNGPIDATKEASLNTGDSEETFWQTMDRKFFTKAVPVEKEEDVLLHHDYDGIRELDNALPPWWVWGFYITIIIAVVYLVNYHVLGTGVLQKQEYKNEVALAAEIQKERMANMPDAVSEANVTVLSTPEALAAGKETFTKNCAACHGQNGEGLVGPNLTDEFWIHGGGIKNLFKTVTIGVPDKGMISWKAQLAPAKIQEVTSYILSLQGSKPANGKAPQGDKWVDDSAPKDSSAAVLATDSTATSATK